MCYRDGSYPTAYSFLRAVVRLRRHFAKKYPERQVTYFMKNAFRRSLASVCAVAFIALGQPALPAAPPIAGASAKLESNAKLEIVSGNNQLFTGPKLTGTPCPYTNGACNFPAYKVTFSALTVKLTNLGGAPIANAATVFTCHMPTGWLCQFSPSGPSNGTTSIVTTDGNGVATLNHMGGNALSTWCYFALNSKPCQTITIGYPGWTVTVTAAYSDLASTTFNLKMLLFY